MRGQLNRRSHLVYGTLVGVWLAVLVWQIFEHLNVRRVNRVSLVNRGRDITMTLGLVLRSQRRFGLFTLKERLEPALQELIRPGELNAIALLSPGGEQIASAGASIDITQGLHGPGVYWGEDSLTLMNLVDLGTSEGADNAGNRTTIIVTEDMVPNPFSTNRGSFRRRNEGSDTNRPAGDPNRTEEGAGSGGFRRDRGGRPPFGRPPWMSETEYQQLIQKRGVHSFVVSLSTDQMQASNDRDLWMRTLVLLLTTAAAGASAFAWRNVARSEDLQIRLVRASEMNTHLKEMNLAAAGLAHETRNPLNLIRGLAQLISREASARENIRERAVAIMDESDRVTAQLNEFINYSRQRDVRLLTVSFQKVAAEVARALTIDTDDAEITIRVGGDDLLIEADEPLLRQMLFNLMLNAVQAVGRGGLIEVSVQKVEGLEEATLEVRDNGPGVPPDKRTEIFKPYVTMHQNGTGLGLAIVQQIVSAHGWEVECTANDPQGAVFRVRHLKLAPVKRP
jgi:signal transduction histidine kinase